MIILFVIAALLAIVGIGFLGYGLFTKVAEDKGFCSVTGIVLAIIGAVLIAVSCARFVPTGHTGVVTVFGKVENYTLDSGIEFMAPWKKVIKMDNRTQKVTVDLTFFSSDIQEVQATYTINYQISKADAMTIYSTVGKDYYDKIIAPTVMESVKIVGAQYTAEELVGNRNELAMGIEADLTDKLIQNNIVVKGTAIEDMDFTDAFTNAVEAKQVAAQNKLKAETEAAQKVVEAEAAAEVKRIQTDAEAYEVKVRAEAEAEANRKIAESLTEDLIDYTYATGWDGKLPTYMMGEGTVPVMNVRD